MSLEEVSERVVDELITSIQALEEELKPFLAEIKPVDLTEEQEAEFQAATHCYMCEQPFTAASYEMAPADGIPEEVEKKLRVRKVRDHNHATGEYRGAAHASCNINKKQLKHIPVFFFFIIYVVMMDISSCVGYIATPGRNSTRRTRQRTDVRTFGSYRTTWSGMYLFNWGT